MPSSSPRSLEQLVRQQVHRWQLMEQRQPAAPPSCIAISRLPGSGGAEVGLRVAGALGYAFFGIELVETEPGCHCCRFESGLTIRPFFDGLLDVDARIADMTARGSNARS